MILSEVLAAQSLPCVLSCPYKNTRFQEAEAAPQLEPRSRHSVTLRAPAKPRNPAYPQPLRILVLVQDSGIRPTGDRVL